MNHTPSRKQAVIFFIFSLVLAAGVLAWSFFSENDSPPAAQSHVTATIQEVQKDEVPAASQPQHNITLELRDGKHILMRKGTDEKERTIAVFGRPLIKPETLISTSGTKILLKDNQDTGAAYYFVDGSKNTRTRLTLPLNIQRVKWVGETAFFEAKEEAGALSGGATKIFILGTDMTTRVKIPAYDFENIAEREPGVFVFLTAKKMEPGSPLLGPSISEALEIAAEETQDTLSKKSMPHTLYLTEFRSAEKLFLSLANIEVAEGETITHLTADVEKNTLFFEKNGKFFKVVVLTTSQPLP